MLQTSLNNFPYNSIFWPLNLLSTYIRISGYTLTHYLWNIFWIVWSHLYRRRCKIRFQTCAVWFNPKTGQKLHNRSKTSSWSKPNPCTLNSCFCLKSRYNHIYLLVYPWCCVGNSFFLEGILAFTFILSYNNANLYFHRW